MASSSPVHPKVLAVIPARGGSKGIPFKNIADLCGKPLIAYTIEQALNSSLLTDVIVSTDSEEIADIALAFGASCPFIRPTELSLDSTLTVDVVSHCLSEMERQFGLFYDIVITLQPTTPFRNTTYIDEAVRILINHLDYDSVVSVVDVGSFHPFRMYRLGPQNKLHRLMDYSVNEMAPRQELESIYIRSGDIYACQSHLLRENPRLIGDNPWGLVVDSEKSINIDDQLDLDLARLIMKKNSKAAQ